MQKTEISLTKHIQVLNEEDYEMLMKEIKDRNYWRGILCSCVGKLNKVKVKMSILCLLNSFVQFLKKYQCVNIKKISAGRYR